MDEITRAAIKHAEALYKAGRKSESIAALRKIDDPIAKKILQQIGGRQPSTTPWKRIALVVFALVIVGVGIVFALGQNNLTIDLGGLRLESELDKRLIQYCESEVYGDWAGRGISAEENPQKHLSRCDLFPAYAMSQFPTRLQECSDNSGSDREFALCFEPLEILTGDYDGSFAWSDFWLLCRGDRECNTYMIGIISMHASDYRDCYYRGEYPGMDTEACWAEKGIAPNFIAPTATPSLTPTMQSFQQTATSRFATATAITEARQTEAAK